MIPRRCCSFVASLAVGIAISGCGSKDSSGGASSGEDASRPLSGSPLSKPTQLVGTWFAVTEGGGFEGLEFTKEGKALLGDGSAGITVDYSLLEGGRLSLAAPGGVTTVFETTLSGDQLELNGKGSLLLEGGTQRFRRLKPGETIADAQKERRAARAKAYQERVAALQTFLKQPGLVLAFADAGGAGPGPIALDVQPNASGFAGKAWHDDRPPHLNAISGQLHLDEASNVAQVAVTFGERIAPRAVQPDGGGQISLNATGEGKSLKLAAQVTVGNSPAREMALRSDPKLHGEIVARYEAELTRLEALKQPLIQLLKDHVTLRGTLQSADARKTEPDTAELTLAKDPKSGQYYCEGITVGLRDRGELVTQAAAELVISNDVCWLRVLCPPAREYLLAPEPGKAGKLAGRWSTPGAPTGNEARFDVVEALDAGTRDASFEARRKAIQAIPADAVFTGLAFEDSGFGLEMPIAFRLQITVRPDGAVTGAADYPTLSTRMTVAGKVAETQFGPSLELRYSAAESTPGDKVFFRSIQNGAWRLVPLAGAGPTKLAGYFTGPPVRTATLTLANDESAAQLRTKLADLLGKGAQLYVAKFVGWQTPGVPPTVVEWKLDEATSKVSGRMAINNRALGTSEKLESSYEGPVQRENGWTTLELMQVTPFHSYDRLVGALKLFVCEDSRGTLHLNGAISNVGTVPNDKPLPEFPDKLERCIDLVPVPSVDAATRSVIDKAAADLAKAKADADDATKAAQGAALDARRAKLTPFFPLFQAKTGLVITTDAPAELGTVILTSQVDTERATITGKGIALREMPFREITFETGLDNGGNLTLTPSNTKAPYAFAAPKDNTAAGRGVALKLLTEAERAKLDTLIQLGQRLQSTPQTVLTVETLDATAAKAREAGLGAADLPGIAIYKDRKNDQVAAMFTARSNGRYRWMKEPVALRLNGPVRGKALYIKGGGPTDNLTVVINGTHRAAIASIAQLGGASIQLPADLEILDLRLEAGGTAQARGVVLVK